MRAVKRRYRLNSEYYTASEAQAKLGLSKAMFFRKVNEGLIPKVILPGMKQGFYPRRDVDALALSMNAGTERHNKIVFSRSTPADQIEEMNIGILCFGRDFITPLSERIAFQQKSEFTFHSLKVDGQVVGYISMFRLEPDFLDALLTGRKIERDISTKEMLPFVRLELFDIYVDVIAVDPNLPKHLRDLYTGIMISRFIDLVYSLLSHGYMIAHVYTVTTTIEGNNMVKKLGFCPMEDKSIAPGRIAYVFEVTSANLEQLRKYSRRGQSQRSMLT